MALNPGDIRAEAVTDAQGRRWYTVGQSAKLLGVTRSAIESRVRRGVYTATTRPEILARAPSRRGPGLAYLINADEIDRQRAETLEALGAVEASAGEFQRDANRVARRLAQLEPAYAAAIRAQELAAEQRQRDADRMAADAEAQVLLLEQLRQFYGPVDVEDLLGG